MLRPLVLALVLAGSAAAQDTDALMAKSLGADPVVSYWLPDEAGNEAVGVEYVEIVGAAGNVNIAPGYFRKGPDGFAFVGEISELYGEEPRDAAFGKDAIELTTTMPKPDDPRCCPTGTARWSIDRKTLTAKRLK
jgi:hypothetical protein